MSSFNTLAANNSGKGTTSAVDSATFTTHQRYRLCDVFE